MTIQALKATVLKAKLKDAASLQPSEKASIALSQSLFNYSDLTPVRDQHYQIMLADGIEAIDGTLIKKGYIYAPHWQLPKSTTRLDVRYFSQVDNYSGYFGPGTRQCNLTACAMFAEHLLEKFGKKTLSQRAEDDGLQEPEDYYGKILNKYGDTIDHGAQTKALRDLGIDSYFSYTLDVPEAIHSLENGYPVVLGVTYKVSGHMILLVGYDRAKREFYVHDPYGSRAGIADYYAVVGGDSGKYDVYTQESLEAIWGDSGWGRIPVAVGGRSTGLPTNW
jgi:hypothetical protein